MNDQIVERCERCGRKAAEVVCDNGVRVCAGCCDPAVDFATSMRPAAVRRCGLCDCALSLTERDNHDLCSECAAWIEANPRLRVIVPGE